jgi:hypothetical protein
MTDEQQAGRVGRSLKPSGWAGPPGGKGHFVFAALILGLSAAGWSVAVEVMHIATYKAPVPWAANVEVNEQFRMLSLPDRFGPYRFVSADGELWREEDGTTDGKPDGEIVPDKTMMEQLRIGTSTDKTNFRKRKSNWYTIRVYRDTRVPVGLLAGYWRLEVYYYTGGVDVVPHVPEVCGVAGGAALLGSEAMEISAPGAPGAWGAEPIDVRRAMFQKTDRQRNTSRFSQYYVFSLNGKPEHRRHMVRLRLTSPFVRHAYFAKIQFASLSPVHDPAQADMVAREFAKYFLPQVLKTLPMPEDVRKLEAAGGDE